VNLKEVKALTPGEVYLYWIRERESIRLKKLSGASKPWTDDEILQTYRFCNVRRMDDRVSRWLLDTWYVPHFGHKNMLLACCLARFINLPDSLGGVGFPLRWDRGRIKRVLASRRALGLKVFNGAYVIPGNVAGLDKVSAVLDRYLGPLEANRPQVYPDSMEKTWDWFEGQYGFGSFMAGQVTADLRWALPGLWKDRYDWAPLGPGSKKGMNLLKGRPANAPLKQKQFVKELRELMGGSRMKLPSDLTVRLEAIDWQNTLCEYFKYVKTFRGEGRPKVKYAGVG
jgi:hypothetical protein